MTQIATVEEIIDDTHARIAVPRKTACGHDCEECAGCGVTGMVVRAVAENRVGARIGDKVVVESSTKTALGIVLLVYMVPVVLFLAGYLLTFSLPAVARYAIAVAAFCLGLLPAVRYDRKMRQNGGLTFTIVRLF